MAVNLLKIFCKEKSRMIGVDLPRRTSKTVSICHLLLGEYCSAAIIMLLEHCSRNSASAVRRNWIKSLYKAQLARY